MAQAAQDARLAQHPGQFPRSIDAVLQGNHERVRTDHWPHGLGGARHLPGFHRNQHHIDLADLGWIGGGLDRLNVKISLQAVHLQAGVLQHGEMIAPGDESDLQVRLILGQFCKPPAKITAHAAGAKHTNTHVTLHVYARTPVPGEL